MSISKTLRALFLSATLFHGVNALAQDANISNQNENIFSADKAHNSCGNLNSFSRFDLNYINRTIVEWYCDNPPSENFEYTCQDLDEEIGKMRDIIKHLKEQLAGKSERFFLRDQFLPNRVKVYSRDEVEMFLKEEEMSLKNAKATMLKAQNTPLHFDCPAWPS